MQPAWLACFFGDGVRTSQSALLALCAIRPVVAALRRVAVKLRQMQEQSTGLAFVILGMYGIAIDWLDRRNRQPQDSN